MEAMIEKLLSTLAIMAAVMSLSAAATLGAALVCRWMKWAPFNVTINVNNNVSKDSSR